MAVIDFTEAELEQMEDGLEHIETQSKAMKEIVDKVVAVHCSELDAYIKQIETVQRDVEHPPTDYELCDFAVMIPIYLYSVSTDLEFVGIRQDIAEAVRKEVFSEAFNSTNGTVADKTATANLTSQVETITQDMYARAYKVIRAKLENATRLLDSVKKVITLRTAGAELSGKVPKKEGW